MTHTRPDPKTASDEELALYIIETMKAEIADAANDISVQRLLVSKGLCTMEEIEHERQMAMAIMVEVQIKAMRGVDLWDKDGESKITEMINGAVRDYIVNGYRDTSTPAVMKESIEG